MIPSDSDPIVPEPPPLPSASGSPTFAVTRKAPSGLYRVLLPMIAAMVFGLFLEGEIGHLLLASWEVALLAVMCVLAYAGRTRRFSRVLSWLLLAVLLMGTVFLNIVLSYGAIHGLDDKPGRSTASDESVGLAVLVVFVLSIGAALAGLLARSSGFRRFCPVPIADGEWTGVRVLALAAVGSFTLLLFVPLVVLGEPPLLAIIRHSSDPAHLFDNERGVAGMLRDQLYSMCWTLLGAALAVGYGINRGWPETLDRLGLKRASRRQVWMAVALTGLFLLLAQCLDAGITSVWKYFGWAMTDTTAVEALFAPMISVVGAVVVGITAGVGEEVVVRGILQPRMGIFLSNLFFTSLHAYQYSWDGLLAVFFVGLGLGFLRKKTSTTVSAMVHGSYDFVLILWGALMGGS